MRTVTMEHQEGSQPQTGDRLYSYRSIFLSDIHLGARISQSESVVNLVDCVDSQTYYLVGDIIDGWRARAVDDGAWSHKHEAVLACFEDKAARGSAVIYVPGNHDEKLRDWLISEGIPRSDRQRSVYLHGLGIQHQAIHTDLKGNRYLVVHGDEFDGFLTPDTALVSAIVHAGDKVYDAMNWSNRQINNIRRAFNLPYYSYSGKIKSRIKGTLSRINDTPQRIADYLDSAGLGRLIYGHTHTPEIETLPTGHMVYNTGDAVDNITMLAEAHSGEFHLISYAVAADTYRAMIKKGEKDPSKAFAFLAEQHGAVPVPDAGLSPKRSYDLIAQNKTGQSCGMSRSKYTDLIEIATYGPADLGVSPAPLQAATLS